MANGVALLERFHVGRLVWLRGMKNGASIFIKGLALWLVATTAAITVVSWRNHRLRAVLGMGWGLIELWIFVGGALMCRFRGADPVGAVRDTTGLENQIHPLCDRVGFDR